jgi:hypothetical protein
MFIFKIGLKKQKKGTGEKSEVGARDPKKI